MTSDGIEAVEDGIHELLIRVFQNAASLPFRSHPDFSRTPAPRNWESRLRKFRQRFLLRNKESLEQVDPGPLAPRSPRPQTPSPSSRS